MSIPTVKRRKGFEPRSPSIKARLNAVKAIKQSIDPLKAMYQNFPSPLHLYSHLARQEDAFINKLKIADRIVFRISRKP